jgi:thiamine-phosphate pyrophosphorylase
MLAALSCQTASVNDRGQRLHDARLYLVCDERPSTFLECALTGGVDIVQVRIKDAGDDERIVAAARRYRPLCERFGALLIVNDRPDLVAAAGADGVHVGQDDVAVDDARAVVGADALVGLSTHSPAQIDAAAGSGADYIGVGPVHATPTKPGRPAVGLELVDYAARHSALPFFAIGGIDPHNAAAVRGAGATRIAVVRALTEASDPEAAARALRPGSDQGRDSEVSVGAT